MSIFDIVESDWVSSDRYSESGRARYSVCSGAVRFRFGGVGERKREREEG